MPKSPTRQLAEDHEYVLLVVGAMEAEAARMERTGTVDIARVARMVEFTRDFTDGDHHVKEESLLFPLLEERSTAAGATVSILLSEHEAARDCIRKVAEALPDAGARTRSVPLRRGPRSPRTSGSTRTCCRCTSARRTPSCSD